MNADRLSEMWSAYRAADIDRTLDPRDHMFNTAKNGWTDYLAVGGSAMQIIHSILGSGPSYEVKRILDFGCGHGRVARHLRAFFPQAELFFADIDAEAAGFCAQTFGGAAITSNEDFAKLDLPADLDLIWLGSVFTHLDFGRMTSLFDILVAKLRRRGSLIATFRGEHLYRQMKAETDPNIRRKWHSLLRQYEAGGIGYAPYEPNNPLWGLSLSSKEQVIGMGRHHPDLRLIGYSEVGWAAVHDVAAWGLSPTPVAA